jgi:alpha-galactosidase
VNRPRAVMMKRTAYRALPLVLWLALGCVLACAGGGDEDDDPDAGDVRAADDDADDDAGDDDTGPEPCGDGVCSAGENCLNCEADCACFCGDGTCALGEFCAVCPEDCDCERLAATPPMGWNSWNRFGCEIDEQLVRETADALVDSGMRAAGYTYLNMDDCWQVSREEDGTIVADPERFPGGVPALADYVHARGLKFGLYTCGGTLTCQGRPGSYGYESIDARTYAAWGVDYVKVDWCNSTGLDPRERYGVFRDAITGAGGGIVLSICDWGLGEPWAWGPATGQLWRTSVDIADDPWNMLWNAVQNERLAPFAATGAWNDPDMLEVGNGRMSDDAYRTHMGLWAIMAAPLIAGNDLRTMSAATRAILLNPEVIAVDQDPAGVQGRRLFREGASQVWMRPLTGDGLRAVVLYSSNLFGAENAYVTWEEIGLAPGAAWVRDLWRREDLGDYDGGFGATLAPLASVMLLVDGVEHRPPTGESALSETPWKYAAAFGSEVKRDRSAGGRGISIAGVGYPRGLGSAGGSVVLYHLGGRCASLTAQAGIDDETKGAGSVTFEVWADGERLYDSGTVTGGQPARAVRVDLTGRRELKLVVTPAGDDTKGDHADWADAKLTCR